MCQCTGGRVTSNQENLYARARQHLVAGVGAAGRFNGSLGHPVYFARGDGAYLWDVDGRRYLDLNCSHGATILGHNHASTRAAIIRALDAGVLAACETESTVALAERIGSFLPCAERVRYLPSGTEVTLVALRLARAATGRSRILRFEGHFHGMHELVHYAPREPLDASRPFALGNPATAGVPREMGDYVCIAPWNDVAAFDAVMAAYGSELAAVILEPVSYNMGCVPAERAFLEHVRLKTASNGTVLIFDEILSGFRTGVDCMQGHYGVTPDLCTLGKAIANGVPIAVLAGKQAFMDELAPTGAVAQSGTYSGHQFGVQAALATLDELQEPGFYRRQEALAAQLYGGLAALLKDHRVVGRVQGLGARFGLYFGVGSEVRNYHDASRRDVQAMHRFVRGCYARGVYFQTIGHAIGHSGFNGACTEGDITWALEQFDAVLGDMRREGVGG